MLSHMRGHVADMGGLMDAADDVGIAVLEDCAHTMGARWGNTRSGAHGLAACFSTQTYKHINSGEGGFITSDDEELMARATILSGSYMLYGRHDAVPGDDVFERIRLDTPNCSGRMDNLRAAILRPQLAELDRLVDAWNVRYRAIEEILESVPGVRVPRRPDQEKYVGKLHPVHGPPARRRPASASSWRRASRAGWSSSGSGTPNRSRIPAATTPGAIWRSSPCR